MNDGTNTESSKQLLENTYRLLWKVANKMQRTGALAPLSAEDVVQESSVRILKYGGNYDPSKSSQGHYAVTILNQCVQTMKKRRAHRPLRTVGAQFIDSQSTNNGRISKSSYWNNKQKIIKAHIGRAEPPEAGPVSQPASTALMEAVGLLKPRDRAVVEAIAMRGTLQPGDYSLEALGEKLGLSKQGVSLRRKNALQMMRIHLKARGIDESNAFEDAA